MIKKAFILFTKKGKTVHFVMDKNNGVVCRSLAIFEKKKEAERILKVLGREKLCVIKQCCINIIDENGKGKTKSAKKSLQR